MTDICLLGRALLRLHTASISKAIAVTVSLSDDVPDGLRHTQPDDRLSELRDDLLKGREPRHPRPKPTCSIYPVRLLVG
jgi:hypothetical protein